MEQGTSTLHLNTLSKLLAVENISVIKTNDRTASFDIENRVLRMPTLKESNPALETMLTFHEIGHALYTPMEYVEIIKKEEKKKDFHYYLNVVEDVRIEKLVKAKYPGTVKDFLYGYREVIKTDLLGVGKLSIQQLNAMSLIDRLNLRFKLGAFCGISFTKKEQAYITAIEKCVSIADVYRVCLELYQYVEDKKKEEQQKKDNKDQKQPGTKDESGEKGEQKQQSELGDESNDDDSSNEESESDDVSGDSQDGNKQNNQPEDDSGEPFNGSHKSETVDTFNKELRSQIDTTVMTFVDMEVSGKINETTVEDCLKFLNSTPDKFKTKGGYRYFKIKNDRIVNHMVQLFESKKAAEDYKKNKTTQSGHLSASKLVNYRVSDNIFKTFNVVHDEKNHGILIFLDWSASIGGLYRSYLEQLITLISFCRKVHIKYKVITFTSADTYYDPKFCMDMKQKLQKENKCVFNTFTNIFFNEITNSEITVKNEDFIMGCFYDCRNELVNSPYRMSNTPLLATYIQANKMIAAYKAKYNLNKMSVVFITDGFDNEYDKGFFSGDGTILRTSNVRLLNRKTGTDVKLDLPNSIERVIVAQEMMKAEFPDVKFVCFHIGHRTFKSLNPYVYIPDQGKRERITANNEIIDCVKKNGFTELKTKMFDKLFIIDGVDTYDCDLTIAIGDSKRKILNKFNEQQSSTMNSRIIAQKFIECIA